MAKLLFCDLHRRRRERKFRTDTQFEINDFIDEELRALYRFKTESILFNTNLAAGDEITPCHRSTKFKLPSGFMQVEVSFKL